MTFIDWFYDLKRQLWERFTIKIEDFEKFTSVVNDFKKNGFDITKIMEKYISSISLDDKIKKESDELQILYNQKIELNKSVALWQDQVNQHQHTMNIYYHLEEMNLGLKELKQLRYLILEVSKANKISPDKAVLKFLDDIEKDYDNKLGFETKLKEKQDELAFLNNKVINCRTILQSQSSIGVALSNLLQKGITESDIININQLVEVCTKSNNIDFSNSKIGNQNENFTTKYRRNTDDSKVKSEYWKMWINDLKRYGDIKAAVQKYQINAEKLQKRVYNLDKQKQESTNYIQTASSFINSLNNEISYYKGFIDQIQDQKNKINLSSRVSLVPIFILVNKNSERDDERDDENNR
jgi:predicted RNA-binding protein with EMAP domain